MTQKNRQKVKAEIRSRDGKTVSVVMNAREAIKRFCLECCGWNREYARDCGDRACPLRPFSLNAEI